jgi:prephenate dehydrogenase
LDTTRLAGSNVEMWKDLMLLNQAQILRALESFERHLQLMKGSLQRGDVEEMAAWLEKGVEFRKGLSQ